MSDQNNREEIYSRPVRAGKRTYFFDVKATRGQDLYMTITESKRRFDDDGNVHYQKHKIFLYREDFENFEEGFVDAVQKIDELMATGNYRDPIAERKAKAEAEPVAEESSETVNNFSRASLFNLLPLKGVIRYPFAYENLRISR